MEQKGSKLKQHVVVKSRVKEQLQQAQTLHQQRGKARQQRLQAALGPRYASISTPCWLWAEVASHTLMFLTVGCCMAAVYWLSRTVSSNRHDQVQEASSKLHGHKAAVFYSTLRLQSTTVLESVCEILCITCIGAIMPHEHMSLILLEYIVIMQPRKSYTYIHLQDDTYASHETMTLT